MPCLERPLYSAGQLLTADSLRLGQRYFDELFALRRYVDGVGIVCGLHVRCDSDQPGWVIVEPGYAIDCCGRDIVLCEPVRFNLCRAIAECPKPEEPCEELPEEEEAPEQLDAVTPGVGRDTRPDAQGTIRGTVVEAATGRPLAGAQVVVEGTGRSAVTDSNGHYVITDVPAASYADTYSYIVRASLIGYRSAQRSARVGKGQTTQADFHLTPAAQPVSLLSTYVLRVEGAWEGRSPVPVVTNRGCDPRPECRPSKEVASVRLCVEALEERTGRARVEDRTAAFRKLGEPLFDRIAYALEATSGLEPSEKNPNPQGRAIADALLTALRDEPARSSCNLVDLICDVRRMLRNEPPRCFHFPDEVRSDPERALVGFVGQLLDDFREEYLALGCDDCCDRSGVRLAHVVIQEVLEDCGGERCSLAGIDSHAPGRETLHPRSAWWQPDLVPVYDAYFRGQDEAGVLLTGRGLQAEVREANQAPLPFSPTLPESVRQWMADHGGQGELQRLGVYQHSMLYSPFSSSVVLWTVAGRVVAITQAYQPIYGALLKHYRHEDYLRYAVSFPVVKRVIAEHVEKSGVQGLGRRQPAVVAAQALPRPVREAVYRGGERVQPAPIRRIDLAKLEPAPFRNLIRGIGPKTEAQLYRAGKTTLRALLETPNGELGSMMRPQQVPMVKEQVHKILSGEVTLDDTQLETWVVDARRRLAEMEEMERRSA
ncbi:MAG: carboxypeptidase-like regulatory domain-containing protein [Gemmatimonadetes bacterium]|nr:carboxypeptidase-like regulatory domain-containing protein [Gemmatimonadota bacterium]